RAGSPLLRPGHDRTRRGAMGSRGLELRSRRRDEGYEGGRGDVLEGVRAEQTGAARRGARNDRRDDEGVSEEPLSGAGESPGRGSAPRRRAAGSSRVGERRGDETAGAAGAAELRARAGDPDAAEDPAGHELPQA